MKRAIDQFFVGREKEIEQFREILMNPREEKDLIYIWGPGGIGKTWLVYKMLEVASTEFPDTLVPEKLIDMYSTGVRHIEGLMQAIVGRLRVLDGIDAEAFAEYDRVRQELQSARGQTDFPQSVAQRKLSELEDALRRCLRRICEKKPLVLAFDTFENVQNSPVGHWIVESDGLRVPGLVRVIASRNPNPWDPHAPRLSGFSDAEAMDFYYSYSQSREGRRDTRSFIQELNTKLGRNPLLLGLALLWRDLGEFGTKTLTHTEQLTELRQRIVWSLRSTEAMGLRNLGGLELDEPMYQALVCMAYLNRRFNKFFLNKLIESGYVFLGDTSRQHIWNQLQQPHFFFVKDRPEGEVQLHDELAEMFKDYLLSDVFDDLDGSKWRQFTSDIVKWYDELIETSSLTESAKDVLRIEKLAYVLQIDAPSERRKPDFSQAKVLLFGYRRRRSDVLDRLLISELDKNIVDQFSLADRYEVYIELAEIAKRINLLDKSASYWQSAVGLAQQMKDSKKEVEALIGQHNSTWQTVPQFSLELLEEALWICDTRQPSMSSRVLYELGFTHYRLQDLQKSIKYYEEAQELAMEYKDGEMLPTILNDLGYNYLMIGYYRKAQNLIDEARRARSFKLDSLRKQYTELREITQEGSTARELADQIHNVELKLGMTYNTIADMHRSVNELSRAIDYYQTALDIFTKEDNPYWITVALYSRGETKRRLARSHYEKGQRELSLELDNGAHSDIMESLALCEQYGLYELSDTAKRSMGRLLHDRALRIQSPDRQIALLDEAYQHFEKGLEIAQETGDVLEELENLTEIAFLADDYLAFFLKHRPVEVKEKRKKLEEFIQRLQRGIQKHRDDQPQIYQFPVFEKLLEIELGAFYYVLREYEASLQYYVSGFIGLATHSGYGVARYREHLDHLIARIRGLREPEIEGKWCETFLKTWRNTKAHIDGQLALADVFPELIDRIELYMRTAFIYRK